jgi:hypothetical protein
LDLTAVSWADSRFVAVGAHGTIVSSRDGATWVVESIGTTLESVSWLGDHFMATGDEGTFLTSTDGHAWTAATTGDAADYLYSVAKSPTTYAFGDQTVLLWTTDLSIWSHRIPLGSTSCHSMLWTGSQFMGVCNDGSYLSSTDGMVWSSGLIDKTTEEWSGVVWTGSQFVAVDGFGDIVTSPDGKTWTPAQSGVALALSSIAWSGQLLVAVGQSGTTVASPDGVTWTAGTAPGGPQLEGIAWAGDHFLAVGWQATAVQSTDGITWTSVALPDLLDIDLSAVAFSGQRSVLVGDSGVIVVLDP